LSRPKRINLEERNGVVGKECTQCSEWKELDEYWKDKSCLGGRKSACKDCKKDYIQRNKEHYSEIKRKSYEANKDKILESHRKYRKQNKEAISEQGRKYYEQNKEAHAERSRKNYLANRENVLKRTRQYYEDNKERHAELVQKWRKENKERDSLIRHRRLARKKALPDTLTVEEYSITLDYFGNSCALTGRTEVIEKEHAIPLSVGHGGTTFGNCYPMSGGLNQSKADSNIFEWFNVNRQRFELSQERFDKLIDYLASANAMTVEEYRDYVYWCHANPRNIDELEAQ
jgi:hypothetical protein